jgi:1-acyl-sn-glycerol-3-phosphate acyltransferase
MTYRIVKWLMSIALRLFYARIIPVNLENIPAKGPVLLIANHPSSLMDAAILGILSKRPIHFFARGDIFINGLVKFILQKLHMHPIHNHSLGRSTINNNDHSFQKALDLLNKGEMILFFPEGISHVDYHIRSFKKGAFRLAYNYLTQPGNKSLFAQPIGINYSHPTKPFSQVWVNVGHPENLELPSAPVFQNENSLIKHFTETLYDRVKHLSLHAEPENAWLLAELLQMARHQYAHLSVDQQMGMEKRIEENLPLLNPLEEKIKDYHEQLKQHKVTDEGIALSLGKRLPKTPLILGFPTSVIGWLLHGIPVGGAKALADKKVYRTDFYSWILVASSILLSIFWYLLIFLFAKIFVGTSGAVIILLITLLCGKYAWEYYRYFIPYREQQKAYKLGRESLENLQKKRKGILNELSEITGLEIK